MLEQKPLFNSQARKHMARDMDPEVQKRARAWAEAKLATETVSTQV
jgi:hypothetical protein